MRPRSSRYYALVSAYVITTGLDSDEQSTSREHSFVEACSKLLTSAMAHFGEARYEVGKATERGDQVAAAAIQRAAHEWDNVLRAVLKSLVDGPQVPVTYQAPDPHDLEHRRWYRIDAL
jgi:hypothetical protein